MKKLIAVCALLFSLAAAPSMATPLSIDFTLAGPTASGFQNSGLSYVDYLTSENFFVVFRSMAPTYSLWGQGAGISLMTTGISGSGAAQLSFHTALDWWNAPLAPADYAVQITGLTGYISREATLSAYALDGSLLSIWNAADYIAPGNAYADLSLLSLPIESIGHLALTSNVPGLLMNITSITFDITPMASTPIPGALWLLGSGLAGIVAIKRRKIR